MNRGDRQEAIFEGDPDRALFIKTLAETRVDEQLYQSGGKMD